MKISVTPETLKGPPPLPSAFYRANITGQKTRTSANGNLVLNLECTIASDSPDENIKTIGRKVYIGMTITEKAIGMVARDYRGITGNELPLGDFTVDELVGRITSDCIGKGVMIQVETKPHPSDPERFISNVTKITPADD